MQGLSTHLSFNGNCREAMHFYKQCLGAELDVMPFSETPCNVPADQKDRIAHARLTKGSVLLMASDGMATQPLKEGNNFCVAIQCESLEEIEKLFTAFSEGGKVTLPLQDMFWGARFGLLTDRFGINWMFNCELPKSN
jgi:PhnB protein